MNVKPLAALEGGASLDFWHNDDPKCPHCGAVYDIEDNDAWRLYSEGEHSVTCPDCDLDYQVETHVTYSFSTENQEPTE